ncbi:MAG: PilZ domain-containing protein [Bdellovibrionales bacterium]|nr:PilZ domain-containing protein [Bdellovibrionales bacterium]
MNTPSSFWTRLAPRDISLRRGLVLVTVVTAIFTGLYLSQWGERIERRSAHPVAFQIRHFLGMDPKIDPRLKVYAFDDSTLKYVDDEDLTLKQWADTLESFVKANPKAVLIPKLFGTPRGRSYARTFVKRLERLKFPIITAAVLTRDASRASYPLDRDFYSLEALSAAGKKIESLDSLKLPPADTLNAIGPHPSIQKAFSHVGHINYYDDFFFSTFTRVTEKTALPAAPFLLAESLYFDDGNLYADGRAVPADHHGRVLINMGAPSKYYERIYALKSVLKRAEHGEQVTTLPENAVVLLLFMFSPNVDMTQSPFGPVPEGLVLNALVNSVLTNQWIRFLPMGALWVAIFCLIGGALGLYFQASQFWIILGGMAVSIFAAGWAAFSYASMHTPWFFSGLGLLTTGATVFLEKYRLIDMKTRRVRAALDGLVPKRQLLEIIKQPLAELTKPSEHVTTIMFIDVIGFYLTAETQAPATVFLSLKELLSRLTNTIHEFNGIVDKTTGDGMLCFFGYDYVTGKVDPDHANKALACAIEIQRTSLKLNLEAHEKHKALFPLRIGLNTGNVFIGDLGNAERMDFTIIGHAINFAKRLESACEDYCVMLGASTYDLVTTNADDVRIKKKMLQIKHYQELVEGYEVDPLANLQIERQAALAAYWNFAHKVQHSPRWEVPESTHIDAHTKTHGSGRVVNFSQGGMAIELDQYLARGVILEFSIESNSTELADELKKIGLSTLVGEIRWGRPKSQGCYLHGVALQNLTETQSQEIQRLLRSVVTSRALKKTG